MSGTLQPYYCVGTCQGPYSPITVWAYRSGDLQPYNWVGIGMCCNCIGVDQASQPYKCVECVEIGQHLDSTITVRDTSGTSQLKLGISLPFQAGLRPFCDQVPMKS